MQLEDDFVDHFERIIFVVIKSTHFFIDISGLVPTK